MRIARHEIPRHEISLRIERPSDSLSFMTKRVIDLTADELDAFAREALNRCG